MYNQLNNEQRLDSFWVYSPASRGYVQLSYFSSPMYLLLGLFVFHFILITN